MKAAHVIGLGRICVGMLDGAHGVIFAYFVQGVSLETVFPYVASGLLGRASCDGGSKPAALGATCHSLIALTAAGVYWAASLAGIGPYRKPWIGGPIFGISAYFFRQHAVLPLSAVSGRAPVPHLVTANCSSRTFSS